MTRLEQLQKLAIIQPNDAMVHYGVGLECINLARWPDAVAAFSQAIGVDPKYAAAYYHKARAELNGGAADAARATLESGMKIARDVGDWHTEGEMRGLLETIE